MIHFHVGINRLGDEAAKFLSEGLKKNRVRDRRLSFHLLFTFIQTLRVLDLQGNCIRDEGGEHLAFALRGNRVSRNTAEKISIESMSIDFTKIKSWTK